MNNGCWVDVAVSDDQTSKHLGFPGYYSRDRAFCELAKYQNDPSNPCIRVQVRYVQHDNGPVVGSIGQQPNEQPVGTNPLGYFTTYPIGESLESSPLYPNIAKAVEYARNRQAHDALRLTVDPRTVEVSVAYGLSGEEFTSDRITIKLYSFEVFHALARK